MLSLMPTKMVRSQLTVLTNMSPLPLSPLSLLSPLSPFPSPSVLHHAGKLDYAEFEAGAGTLGIHTLHKEDMKCIFEAMDCDGDGYIDATDWARRFQEAE